MLKNRLKEVQFYSISVNFWDLSVRKILFFDQKYSNYELGKAIYDQLLMIGALTGQNKKEPSIFLKILINYRLVISSKFPKSFKGARDSVVFYDCSDFLGPFPTLLNSPSTIKSPAPLILFGILLEIT